MFCLYLTKTSPYDNKWEKECQSLCLLLLYATAYVYIIDTMDREVAVRVFSSGSVASDVFLLDVLE